MERSEKLWSAGPMFDVPDEDQWDAAQAAELDLVAARRKGDLGATLDAMRRLVGDWAEWDCLCAGDFGPLPHPDSDWWAQWLAASIGAPSGPGASM